MTPKPIRLPFLFIFCYADFSNFICVLYLYFKNKQTNKKAGEIAVFTLATEPH